MFGTITQSLEKLLSRLKREEIYICGDEGFYRDLQHEHIENLIGKKVIIVEELAVQLTDKIHPTRQGKVIHFHTVSTFQFLDSIKEKIQLSLIPSIDDRQKLKEDCVRLGLSYTNINELSLTYYQLWKEYRIGTPIFFTKDENVYKKALNLDIKAYLYK